MLVGCLHAGVATAACLAAALAAAAAGEGADTVAGRAAVASAGRAAVGRVAVVAAGAATVACLDAGTAVAAGTVATVFAFLFTTQTSLLCFCCSCLLVSWAFAALRAHAWRIGAGEVDMITALRISKISLAQAPVQKHSRYCARRSAATRPKTGIGGKAVPILCSIPVELSGRRRPSYTASALLFCPLSSALPARLFLKEY